MRKSVMMAVMAAGLVACSSAQSSPAPIATISVNSNAAAQGAPVAVAEAAQFAGPVTFIEFYSEW